MTQLEQKILVSQLAAADAVWLPLRRWERPRPALTYFARRDYHRLGTPWRSGGRSPAAWKAAERAVSSLAAAGLLTLHRARSRLSSVKLTDQGEAIARRLCCLPSLAVSLVALAELARHSTTSWVCERVMVDESIPLNVVIDPKELMLVEDMLLPSLVRGYCESNSDVRGLVCYRLLPAGLAALEDAAADPPPDPPGTREGREWYIAAVRRALDRLAVGDPRGELGLVPLPASFPAIGRVKP